jgi:hypothetical protein
MDKAVSDADAAKFRALGNATASPEEMQKAFETFQRASQRRDDDPEAFQAARFRYYATKNGPEWMEQEKKRINAEKLDPVLNKYRSQIQDLDAQSEVQKGYTDSIATIRDKQSSLKQGIAGNVDFLKDLLMDKEQKVSVYNRFIDLTSPSSPTAAAITSANPLASYFAVFPSSFLWLWQRTGGTTTTGRTAARQWISRRTTWTRWSRTPSSSRTGTTTPSRCGTCRKLKATGRTCASAT